MKSRKQKKGQICHVKVGLEEFQFDSPLYGVLSSPLSFPLFVSCECSGTVSIKISWGQNSSCYTGNLNRNQQWSSFIFNTVQHTFRHTLSSFSTCFNHLTYIFPNNLVESEKVFGPPNRSRILNSEIQFWFTCVCFFYQRIFNLITLWCITSNHRKSA